MLQQIPLRRAAATLTIVSCLAAPVPAATRYVRAGADGGGTSWANATGDLQAALTAASSGDQIWVSAGTYKPSLRTNAADPRSVTFQLKNGVAIYGGFPSTGNPLFDARDPALHVTTLSGDLGANDGPDFANIGDNCYHVVTGSYTDGTAILDGFVISGGNADAGVFLDAYGAGMLNLAGSPTVSHCTFAGGSALSGAGGIMNESGSNPKLTACVFINNRGIHPTASSGGAMLNNNGSNPLLIDCTFTNNRAVTQGGAVASFANSKSHFARCLFKNNHANYAGAVIYFSSNDAIVEDCTFIANYSVNGPGALYNYLADSQITDCTFIGNYVTGSISPGGAVFNQTCSPIFTRCRFYDNTATDGGGISWNGGNGSVVDCVFSGNKSTGINSGGGALSLGGGVKATVTECVFAGNSSVYVGGAILNASNSAKMTNCAFIGNTAPGTGGAMYSSSPGLLINCTLSGNTGSALYSQFVIPTYTNLVAWDNPGGEVSWSSGAPVITYSCIQGGFTGPGNISADPVFIGGPAGTWTANASYDSTRGETTFTDASAGWVVDHWARRFLNPDTTQLLQGYVLSNTTTQVVVAGDFASLGARGAAYRLNDYRLSSGSPAIDVANNTAVPAGIVTDQDHQPRFWNDPLTPDSGLTGGAGGTAIVDMGAYEFLPPNPADFNGDSRVDAIDLALFQACMTGPSIPYQPANPPPGCILTPVNGTIPADFDQDSDVDQSDFGTFQRCHNGPAIAGAPGCGML